ncbi:DUF1338 domain-containing protein [Novosphingobium sp. PC22D]|uniref:2-oxoadipate dioxygenase/decarboxylase family protein n=1 Tax=Novosphingobium sp. PC22D TaxID=1962403 RepID=UPI000BF0361C|nr:DUF1338 family protein [Novosphingobium sp. PC22D]PEQ12715.1 DUF1338 domain-containing protein [Novosphingobium sp. PC22D]
MATKPPASDFPRESVLFRLLSAVMGEPRATYALTTLEIEPQLFRATERINRAHLAMALNAVLFVDLLDRVPTAARYVGQQRQAGEKIVFDHGALRTVDSECGDLMPGYGGFARFLDPLGYDVRGVYPLPNLKMTGRAFVHRDFPEAIPQFFVSELHLDDLPGPAQVACMRVFGNSRDPITVTEWSALDALVRDGEVFMTEAITILKGTVRAFGRQHQMPALADYETLLQHTPEGAWIATEGNVFNHATTRVPDVIQLAHRLKAAGYPMKATVEVSRNNRVRQTAFVADKVRREFRTPDGFVERMVPGSFYEFISRDIDPANGTIDLTFDSGNATGIFAVTREQ